MGKCNRNIPPITYSAIADFHSKGECSDGKLKEMTNNKRRMTKGIGGMWRRGSERNLPLPPSMRGNVAIIRGRQDEGTIFG